MKKLLILLILLTACQVQKMEEIKLQTEDGVTIHSTFYNANSNKGVILLHRLAKDRTNWKEFASLLVKNNFSAAFHFILIPSSLISEPLLDDMILATNTGSLYSCKNIRGDTYIFASESYFLKSLLKRLKLESVLGRCDISQMKPGEGRLIDIHELREVEFNLNEIDF